MFATIRRHQKWLWLVIIFLVIIAFVVLMDPTYSVTGGRIGGEGGSFGTINGRPIPREELLETYAEVRLRYRLLAGQWPEEDANSRGMFEPDRLVPERLLMVEKLRELDVQVDDAAVADWIATVFRDRERNVFDLDAYRQFVRNVLPQGRLTEEDLKRFARHEVGIQHVLQLAGMSGSLVTPREAEAQFRIENELVSVEMAQFASSNYLAEVTIDQGEVLRFFTNRLAQYRLPERVQVSYVRFDTTNFLAEADAKLEQEEDLEALLESRYQQVGPDYFRDSDGNVLPPEAAKEQMKESERKRLAVTAGRQRAMSFAEQLYELYQQAPEATDNLERLAAATGLASGVTEPFAAHEFPPGLRVYRDFVQAAFSLGSELPMATEPLVGEDAIYVIALHRRLPSEPPAWETVELRVTSDYRRLEALRLAQEAGRAFYGRLTNGLAGGKTFQEICQEANVVWVQPPAISQTMRSAPGLDEAQFTRVKEVALSLPVEEVSEFVPTSVGGMIVHVTGREPVDEGKVAEQMPAYLEQLRQDRQREALSEWFRKEAEKTVLLGLPAFERTSG
jgi:peptidyl-prolyl cis-trans isomerase D